MVAIGICWNGMSKPYLVGGNAKVTAQYFINNVLSPMVDAKSQVAILTPNWMEENHPNYIPEYHWMAKSPDLAPLDYAVNEILKKTLGRRMINIAGLSKVLKVCENFDLRVIRKSLLSREGRVQKMLDTKGNQVEIDG
ncbi:hypothetical protein RvY_11344 [Ramazzottius varieornatus]|uniref:Uncharacterized protein n=1 Tax=Ramazzottius varieornatus TaxID=947166 RepID=A0A1D1VFU3_RAMVA|nr:hypothetical protein RvY_11344 [Ramazzottius varieornatus]